MKQYSKIQYAIVVSIVLGIMALAYFSLFYDGGKVGSVQEINRYENAINVKDVGAVGDGITDDTAAIQQAIDQAAKQNLIVYVPNGTYIIDPEKPLNIPTGTKLYGDGKESVLKADAARFGWDIVRIHGQRIEIRHLFMDGNQAVNRVVVVRAGSSQVSLTNTFIANASQSEDKNSKYYDQLVAGIVVYGETSDIKISNSEISNVYAKHATNGSRIARGIYITKTWGATEKAAMNVEISNSYIHDVGPEDQADCLYYEDPNIGHGEAVQTGSVIRNNQFARCAKRAINIHANGVVVEGNKIMNTYLGDNSSSESDPSKKAGADMYSGITINADNVTVRNNTLEGIGSFYAGIEIGVYDPIKGITVTNNRVFMGKASKIEDTTAIRIGNVDQYTITSNRLENGLRGIWTWLSSSNGRIADNVIIMPQGGGIDLSTYLTPNYQQKMTVENNRITASGYMILSDPRNQSMTIIEEQK